MDISITSSPNLLLRIMTELQMLGVDFSDSWNDYHNPMMGSDWIIIYTAEKTPIACFHSHSGIGNNIILRVNEYNYDDSIKNIL